ncbi:transporter suffix domain-containing protein [Chryseobacterium sp. PMSZPI]|uniref:transporter suffix domain-containing protein n=1 Tax=Chryseobacterium sp. PMSZPI TaxID=1033900 RepID=UPI0039A2187E
MAKEKWDVKKKWGLVFLGMGIVCLIEVPVFSFLDFPNKAVVVTAILIAGEVLFFITITLSGQGYWEKLTRFFSLKRKKN